MAAAIEEVVEDLVVGVGGGLGLPIEMEVEGLAGGGGRVVEVVADEADGAELAAGAVLDGSQTEDDHGRMAIIGSGLPGFQ